MKSSFIVHLDSLDVIDDLSDEQCGELLRAMRAYHSDDEFTPSAIVKVAFSQFKNQFSRDQKKYKSIVERNRINGSKGGRPPLPNKPTGLSGNPDEPKKADSDSGSKSVNDSGNDNESKKEKPKQAPAKKQQVSVIEYPPELNKPAWDEWIENRRQSKIKKLTPKGEILAVNKLIAMGDWNMQRKIIEQSMAEGYTGLFPLKKQVSGKSDENAAFRESLQSNEDAIEGYCHESK